MIEIQDEVLAPESDQLPALKRDANLYRRARANKLCELCGTVHRHSCSTEFFLYGVLCGIGYAIAYLELFQ